MLNWLRCLTIEPVNLSFKEKCIATLACFCAILTTALLTRLTVGEYLSLLVASMGASAVILFIIPSSPLAQPWPFVGGQLLSASAGVICAFYIPDVALSAATAVGLAVFLMLLLRCLHPPGAATALSPILSGIQKPALDIDFIVIPVGVNVLIMLLLAWLINRIILRRDYPIPVSSSCDKPQQSQAASNKLTELNLSDIAAATRDFDHFLDIGAEELLQIFSRLQLHHFQKQFGPLSCGEIMEKNVVTVDYATEVEDAWALMHSQQYKALPVLDKTRRVIGIVTRYDFFKNVKLTPYRNFQDKWLAFVKKSDDVNTHKPEAIGHIMTRQVKTLSMQTHIAELLPLVINEGHHHVPIVDDQDRFVGMVFQSRLISALFKEQLISPNKA